MHVFSAVSWEYSHKSTQWGWIPTIRSPYVGQEADPILQGFRRRAVSMQVTENTIPRDNSASTSGLASIRQRILQRFTSATISPPDMPSFVPMGTLTELIDAETVSMALAEIGQHHVSSVRCRRIADSLPRFFATLLVIGNVEAVLEVQLRSFTDVHFPLLRAETPPKGRELEFAAWNSTIYPLFDDLYGGIHPVSDCFQDPSLWTLEEFKRFYNAQWLFSAPIFVPERFEYLLAPQSPLPLTRFTPHRVGGVLCSHVFMASIHPAHLSWDNSVRAYLVIVENLIHANNRRIASRKQSF